MIADLERQFGFDKPAHERFLTMVWNYLQFDFGESYFQDRPVLDSSWNDCLFRFRSGCGRWSRSTAYRFRSESPRRCATDRALTSGPAPSYLSATRSRGFLFAILLIVLFAGGNYLDLFPLRGLVSDNWRDLPWPEKITDYLWHLVLPSAP